VASKTNICNQALLLLGESPITDINEGTPTADACLTFYDSAKEAVLREHEWNCAIVRSAFSATTAPVYEWTNAHLLPSDCLRVLEIETLLEDQWQVETNAAKKRVVVSNLSAINAKWIRNIEEGLMDPMLVKALAAYLASELAYPICESNAKSDQMLSLYGIRTTNAGSVNKLEGTTRKRLPGRLSRVR
jgi:hypothetical protein